MIKLTKILFALSLLVFVTACGSDENDEVPTTAELLGTWVAVSFDGDIETSSTFDGTTTASLIDFEGSNMAYTVTFTENAWTTNGGYDMTTTSTVGGMALDPTTSTVSGVAGTGTYSTDGNVMTIDGSFFEFESNGVPVIASNGPQMADFEINSDGELVFDQDESVESDQGGVVSTSTIKSKSVWTKQ